ncbi:ribosome maturation factor RimP [Altericista sp. CCNU0014]|uniref:ribosome maturation factor RimP n=1 Tax=Altericista sp. CCNU0014 TaxID=3082949 RepID=UPI00385171AC
MTHPLIPHILELAHPVAQALNLEVVNAVLQTSQHPPILRIDVRNLSSDTGLEDCEKMSRALEEVLDASASMPDAYILEVSSPGVSEVLSSDRDFKSFRGFPVIVATLEPYQGRSEWEGSLVGRDETTVRLTQRGRAIAIPRALVGQVQLQQGTEG